MGHADLNGDEEHHESRDESPSRSRIFNDVEKILLFFVAGHFVPPVLRIINKKTREYSLFSLEKAVATTPSSQQDVSLCNPVFSFEFRI